MTTEPQKNITIYLSYAQQDEALKQEFENYLSTLQQAEYISGWVERQVQRGTDWSQVIDPRSLSADIFLLMLSPDFVGSGYCTGAEVRAAFDRHDAKNVRIVPIFLRRANVAGLPVESIQCLPRNAKPIVTWPDKDEAWWDVDQALRHVIKDMRFRY